MPSPSEIVEALKEAGFEKVCVVDKSWKVMANTANDYPKAWMNSENEQVNENQELANDWSKVTSFCFFEQKFNVIQKSGNHIVGTKGKAVLVCKEYTAYWIVALGHTKGMGAKKGASGVFPNAAGAYTKACSSLFDELDEDEE